MAGNFDHVTSGQPFEVRASTWNDILDAAAAVKRGKRNDGGGPLDGLLLPSLKCLVKYDESSTSSLDVFSVLAYSSASIDPTADEAARLNAAKLPAFVGGTPFSRSAPFMITVQPIQGQSWGVAVTAGLVPAYVDVLSLTHHRARPSPGSTEELTSCAANGVPVVWPTTFTETGPQWCIINLTDPAGCCAEPALPYTVPLGCATGYGTGTITSPVGSGGSGGAACIFGYKCDDPGALWTPNYPLTSPPTFGQYRLTGVALSQALASCGANAIIYTFGSCGPDLLLPGGVYARMCVTVFGGTRSYIDFADPMTVNAIFDGTGWYFGARQDDVYIAGRLVLCPDRDEPGWYFEGDITSTDIDSSNPTVYPCGCAVRVAGCEDANGVTQDITAGPVLDPVSETLQITTGCGVLSLRFAACSVTVPPPPPPPPPPPDPPPPPVPPPPEPAVTWDCTGGACIENTLGTGTYDSYAACYASPCTSPPPPPSGGCCDGTLLNGKTVTAWPGAGGTQATGTWTTTASGTTSAHVQFTVGGTFFTLGAVWMVCVSGSFELWGWTLAGDVGTEPPDFSLSAVSSQCTFGGGGSFYGAAFFYDSGGDFGPAGDIICQWAVP